MLSPRSFATLTLYSVSIAAVMTACASTKHSGGHAGASNKRNAGGEAGRREKERAEFGTVVRCAKKKRADEACVRVALAVRPSRAKDWQRRVRKARAEVIARVCRDSLHKACDSPRFAEPVGPDEAVELCAAGVCAPMIEIALREVTEDRANALARRGAAFGCAEGWENACAEIERLGGDREQEVLAMQEAVANELAQREEEQVARQTQRQEKRAARKNARRERKEKAAAARKEKERLAKSTADRAACMKVFEGGIYDTKLPWILAANVQIGWMCPSGKGPKAGYQCEQKYRAELCDQFVALDVAGNADQMLPRVRKMLAQQVRPLPGGKKTLKLAKKTIRDALEIKAVKRERVLLGCPGGSLTEHAMKAQNRFGAWQPVEICTFVVQDKAAIAVDCPPFATEAIRSFQAGNLDWVERAAMSCQQAYNDAKVLLGRRSR